MIDVDALRADLGGDARWASDFAAAWEGRAARVHLAVFVEPFLRYVLDGSKTVESRFSVNATAPYGRVDRGDVLLLKRSGGPIVGVCRAADAWHYELDDAAWAYIRDRFAPALRVDGTDYLDRKAHASFATLIRVDQVLAVGPVGCAKRDRRGWVVVRDTTRAADARAADARAADARVGGRARPDVSGFPARRPMS